MEIAVDTRVRVITDDVTLWHHPKSKDGLNPKGLTGTVVRIATIPRDGSATPISANYELLVKFDEPKLMAHFRADELQVIA